MEEKDYVLLNKDYRVDFGGDHGEAEEANGCFTLCFWIYIEKCAALPSVILEQKHPDAASSVPFLLLDEKKKMMLFPLLFVHQEAPAPDNSIPWTEVPCASTEIEFPVKKWVHVGCEVLREHIRLHFDGEIVGEKPLTCSFNKDLHADALKKLYLACPDDINDKFHGYIHGLDFLSPSSDLKSHYIKDPPLGLSLIHSSTSEIEEDSDGAWSIVGGKASCRRIFSVDVTLLDAFGCPVNKEFEVVASLLYADNKASVENNSDAEPPLIVSNDGTEYSSRDRPCKLINGTASFKLKISQLSSKCDNRLFLVRFDIPELGKYPFLEAISFPIRCVSRSRNSRTTPLTFGKSSNRINYRNECESLGPDDGAMELIPNIVREAKPSPSSKRIKLGQLAMFKEDLSLKQSNKSVESHAWTSNKGNAHGMNMDRRLEINNGAERNSSTSNSSEATNSDSKSVLSDSSPDLIIFKYCLGSPAERYHLLKEIAISAGETRLGNFAEQVSLFSGCSHHRHQIKIAKRLVEEGNRVWTSIPGNNSHVLWENLVLRINEYFKKIACCNRSLTDQDFECLRRIAGCQDLVYQVNFEKLWSWLYPVAVTLSQSAVNVMWDSLSPMWMEGFISKEEAEFALRGPGGLQSPGTFVLRFPTSRSWPHPDAGNLVVTYVGCDYTIHHRLLSHDFTNSFSSQGMTVKPLQDMLLEEPVLSRLGRIQRSH